MGSLGEGQGSDGHRNDETQPGVNSGRLSIAFGIVLIVLAGVAAATHRQWLPLLETTNHGSDEPHAHADESDAHSGHNHVSEPHGDDCDTTSLQLSEQGRKNIGLTLETVALRDFERTIAIPATLVERQGQTKIAVSAPMTGIVTGIHPIRGEAVTPGAPLFDLRMTHEDLVEKQSSLLRSLEELAFAGW